MKAKYKLALLGAVAALLPLPLAACSQTGMGGGTDNSPDSKVKVTFVVGDSTVSEATVERGGKVELAEAPARLGYNFDGWFAGENAFDGVANDNTTVVGKYSSVLGGSGTAADPFTVDSADELALFKQFIEGNPADFASAVYVQTADINSTLTAPVTTFSGVYNGGGYTVTLKAPLFGQLCGAVKNISLGGEFTYSKPYAGGLAEKAAGAVIEDVALSVKLTGGETVGALAGELNGSAKNITATADVDGETVGALVGKMLGGRIEYATVGGSASGDVAGGVIGDLTGGVVINTLCSANVSGVAQAGGIAGALKSGALIQNAVALGQVTSDTVAGGIVGKKGRASSIYRGYYGGTNIAAPTVGGILGDTVGAGINYTDVVNSLVKSADVLHGDSVTKCSGQAVGEYSALNLPSGVWEATPALKSEKSVPDSVAVTVDGEQSLVSYGSRNLDDDLFTANGERFSSLNEFDGEISLFTATPVNDTYLGRKFTAAGSSVVFTADGGTLDEEKLDHVITYGGQGVLSYAPDASNPNYTIEIEYPRSVSVYTDGSEYFALTVVKERLANGYAAFMQCYVLIDNNWELAAELCPENTLPAGGYTYSVTSMIYTEEYHVLVDDNYTVDSETGEGYYLTSCYFNEYVGEDLEYTSSPVPGHGFTIMYLTDVDSPDYISAFVFTVNQDEYVDYVYVSDGKLVNSLGAPVSDDTESYFAGEWMGDNNYAFDLSAKTVTVNGGNPIAYTMVGGVVKFTHSGTEYALSPKPTEFGACMLVDESKNLILAAKTDAFYGDWLAENGMKINISDDSGLKVTVNGAAVTAALTIYKGMSAVNFTANEDSYTFVLGEAESAVMYSAGKTVHAFAAEGVANNYAGNFVAIANGKKLTLSVTADLAVQFNDTNALSGNAKVKKTDDGYNLALTLGSTDYTLTRNYDCIMMSGGQNEYVFVAESRFSDFVCSAYSSDRTLLTITEDGKFAIYDRGTAASSYTALSSVFNQNRASSADESGFVLAYSQNDKNYFFYADFDVRNVRLYEEGKTVKLIDNYVPESTLLPLFGSYLGTDGTRVSLTLNQDNHKLIAVDMKDGEQVASEYRWYPVLNYNSRTQTTTVSAYSTETVDGTVEFEALLEPTVLGMSWGLNNYIKSDYADYIKFMNALFVHENELLEFSVSAVKTNTTTENNGKYSSVKKSYTVTGVSAIAGGLSLQVTDSAFTANLGVNGDALTLTLIKGGENIAYTLVQKFTVRSLVGEYVAGDKKYSVTESELWGSYSYTLALPTGSSVRYSNGETVALSDGTVALTFGNYGTLYYVAPTPLGIKVCAGLDASKIVECTDIGVAKMPADQQALATKLNGVVFKTADESASLTFGVNDGVLTATEGDNSYTLVSAQKGRVFYLLTMTGDTQIKIVYNGGGAITEVQVDGRKYLPDVVYPSEDELKEMLFSGMSFKSASGDVVEFVADDSGWFGTSYNFIVGEDELTLDSISFADNGYDAKFSFGFTEVTVHISYGKTGIQKVTYEGVDYMPVVFPAAADIDDLLDGKTFANAADSTKTIRFAIEPGVFGSYLNAYINGEEINLVSDNENTKDGRVYTIVCTVFTEGVTANTVTVTLNAAAAIEKVEYNGVTYSVEVKEQA